VAQNRRVLRRFPLSDSRSRIFWWTRRAENCDAVGKTRLIVVPRIADRYVFLGRSDERGETTAETDDDDDDDEGWRTRETTTTRRGEVGA
jgi:hypothetical protein